MLAVLIELRLIIVTLFILYLTSYIAWASTEPIARVVTAKGQVEFIPSRSISSEYERQYIDLFPGDMVKTGEHGLVVILMYRQASSGELRCEDRIAVGPNTTYPVRRPTERCTVNSATAPEQNSQDFPREFYNCSENCEAKVTLVTKYTPGYQRGYLSVYDPSSKSWKGYNKYNSFSAFLERIGIREGIINVKPITRPSSTGVLPVPVPLSPADWTAFGLYPRAITLTWSTVQVSRREITYSLEIDCFDCCASNAWCTDSGRVWQVIKGLTINSFTLPFMDYRPRMWRVWGVDDTGRESSKSQWMHFDFTQ
jgi:hypothetical protein